ncbi:MAG: antitoxin [Betaproteobacteria bacterium]|nr:antitoxin [Betaproteobacteria bacterium]
MSKAVLRSIGGSVMVAVPKAFLAQANLGLGSEVDVSVQDGAILLSPARPRYALKDLLAQCDFSKRTPRAESEWQNAAPAGKEVI